MTFDSSSFLHPTSAPQPTCNMHRLHLFPQKAAGLAELEGGAERVGLAADQKCQQLSRLQVSIQLHLQSNPCSPGCWTGCKPGI